MCLTTEGLSGFPLPHDLLEEGPLLNLLRDPRGLAAGRMSVGVAMLPRPELLAAAVQVDALHR